MFQSLADSLDKTFRNLRGVGKISESNVSDALREIRLALLEADVEFSVARDFINRIKDKARIAELGLNGPFNEITFDFELQPNKKGAPESIVRRDRVSIG